LIVCGSGLNDSTMPTTESLRAAICEYLALKYPGPESRLETREEVRGQGFVRRTVAFRAWDEEWVEAFWFEPDAPRGAAVVALHQHNSEWDLGKSEVAGLAGDPLQAFGPALARAGVRVLALDLLGFESRSVKPGAGLEIGPRITKPHGTPEGWLQYYNQAMHRLVRGELLMTKVLGDVAAGVTALRNAAGIERVGVLGHSHGGNLALFAAALDTRLDFVCCSGAACSYRHKLAHGIGLEMALVIPGFAARFDFDDLMRCVAPRPFFVVSADEDVYSADAEDLVARAAPAFADAGAAEHLQHLRVAGSHALDAQRFAAIVEWLTAQAGV
jgi:dienelactone hydrolase